jgi:hypothetical protein
MFDSFIKYQTLMLKTFKSLQAVYGFDIVDGHQSVDAVTAELRKKIEAVLSGKLYTN